MGLHFLHLLVLLLHYKTMKFRIAAFLIVFLFTFLLRAKDYERSPQMGNLEEMLYAWSGIYLVETGTPVSWTTLDYPERAVVFRGTIDYQGGQPSAGVNLYKPWLDEPPLFSALVGYSAHLFGADRGDFIPTAYIRLPVIIISAITSIFVFLVARFVSGFWTGIFSMLIYGTVPIFVLGSRLAVPENLIALFFIIMVYLLLKFQKKPKFIYLAAIPLLAGLSGLAKPTGYFIAPLAMYIAYSKKFYKSAVYILGGTLIFVALYIAYGLYFDPEIFWNITLIQGSRPVGFSSLAWFFISPAVDWRMLIDSFYIFCTLSAAYFIFAPKEKEKQFISFSFIFYVMVVMVSGGEGDLLGWYKYPTFPLLAILGTWGLQVLIKKANVFTTFLAAGMLIGNQHLLINAYHHTISPWAYRIIFSSLMLPSLINQIHESKSLTKLVRIIIVGIIAFGIYTNVNYILHEYEVNCQGATCLHGPRLFISSFQVPIIKNLFSY